LTLYKIKKSVYEKRQHVAHSEDSERMSSIKQQARQTPVANTSETRVRRDHLANPVYGGFQVVGTTIGGLGAVVQTFMVETANNYGTALFQGDVLIPVSDGTCAIAAASNNGLLAYVAQGFSYQIGGKRTPKPYLPANITFTPTTVGSAMASHVEVVFITPDVIFGVCGDAAYSTPTIAGIISLIGENCDLATATAGNTISGQSGMNLGLSTHGVSSGNGNFRVIGVQQYPSDSPAAGFLNNDPTLTAVRFLVTCNEGFWPPYITAGV
jgi:hypothetical protein